MENDEGLVKFFSRHIVILRLFLRRHREEVEYWINTLFVLSVTEKWYLVTAGHHFKSKEFGIMTLLDQGWEIINCHLIDSLGPNNIDVIPIPFVFNFDDWHAEFDDEDPSFDYAVLPLSKYYQELIKKNGIDALSEEVWDKQPSQPELYFLLGNPRELISIAGTKHINIGTVLHKVTPLSERPDGFKPTALPLFYGRIGLTDHLASIRGESGGPIFALQTNIKGEVRYWLIALQSRWLPESRCIAACPTRYLGVAIRDYFGNYSNLEN